MTNKFGELGGFDKIISLIKGQGEGLQFPLSLIGMFLLQFANLQNYTEKTFAERFASDVSQTLMGRLDNLTDAELKELDKEVPKKIIAVVEAFIQICQPNTKVCEISETYELIIAKKYLQSPFFEKRIRGMAEFKEIFGRVQNTCQHTEKEIKEMELPHTKYLTYNKYAEWLSREDILEFIFIDNPHHEFIKRSLELLYLRAIDLHYPLDLRLIKGIWDCCTKKHEEIQRASLAVLQELTQYLKIDTLAEFWKLIRELRNDEIEEMHVTFLRKYSEGALRCLTTKRNELERESMKNQRRTSPNIEFEFLSLHKFWEIGQETNKIHPKTRDLALKSLIEILQNNSNQLRPFNNQPNKLTFIQLALTNLNESSSIYTTLEFLRKILLTFKPDNSGQQIYNSQKKDTSDNLSREEIVGRLIKEDIFLKVIQNAAMYLDIARINLSRMEINSDKPYLVILGGSDSTHTHQMYIDCFINFMEFIIKNSRTGNLTFQHVSTLYENYVLKGVTEYEAKQFFLFLTKENENSVTRERKFILSERIRVEVFKNIMCNDKLLDSTNMRSEGFDCFKNLFLTVN